MKLDYLTLHLGATIGKDDPLQKLGSGFRNVLALSGRKNVTLFSPFTMRNVTIPIEAKRAGRLVIKHGLDTLQHEAAPLDAARLHKIASRNHRDRVAWGIYDGGETAKKFIELLRTEAAANDNKPQRSRKVPKAA
jgi:hypothetical protein